MRASGLALGPKVDGAPIEACRSGEGVERIGAVPRLMESDPSALGNRFHLLARRAGKLERAQIVVSEHLRAVLAIRAQCFDPFGREPVLFGSESARNLPVRDVPDE